MDDKNYLGRLVYLTRAMDAWARRINTKFSIPMACRLAKVIKVFDWETEEGKLLLKARKDSGKWIHQNPEDFKFVLKIYYPDLILKEKQGFTAEEVLPRLLPGTKHTMFEELPEWMLHDFARTEKISLESSEVRTSEDLEKEGKPTKENTPDWLNNYLNKQLTGNTKEDKPCTSTPSQKKHTRRSGNMKSLKNT